MSEYDAPSLRELVTLLVGGAAELANLDGAPVRPRIDDPLFDSTGQEDVLVVRSWLQFGMPRLPRPEGSDWRDTFAPPPDDEHLELAVGVLYRLADHSRNAIAGPQPVRVAAAIAWLTLMGNRLPMVPVRPRFTAEQIWRTFGVSDCAELGRNLRRASGPIPDGLPRGSVWLARTEFLHSVVRRFIVGQRDLELKHVREATSRPPIAQRPVDRHLRIVR